MTCSASLQPWSAYYRLEDIQIPDRSRLFSIEPIGIGTWYSESFGSYLKRIAEAHRVSVTNLLQKVLLPGSNCHIKKMHPLWRSSLHSINGSSDLAEVFVNLLENATYRNLNALTLLPLESIIGRSGRGVLSKQLKICPYCLYEFSKKGAIFIPLIWWLQNVNVCPIHGTKLRCQCSFCDSNLKSISNQVPIDVCDKCGFSLAEKPTADMKGRIFDLAPGDRITCELIASLNQKTFFRNTFLSALKRLIRTKQDNDQYRNAFKPMREQQQLKQWVSGRNHPRLSDLISFSADLNVSLFGLLSGQILPAPKKLITPCLVKQ